MEELDWHPATLSLRGTNFYAYLTVPKAAQTAFGKKQHRLSTKTSDRKQAAKRLHELESKMRSDVLAAYHGATLTRQDSAYSRLLTALQLEKQNYTARWDPETDVSEVPYTEPPADAGDLKKAVDGIDERIASISLAERRLDSDFIVEWFGLYGAPPPRVSDLVPIRDEAVRELEAALGIGRERPVTLLSLLPQYEAHIRELVANGHLREKTARARPVAIREFADTVGDPTLTTLKPAHGYEYAQALSAGRGNKTIKTRISHVSTMLDFAVHSGKLEQNPLRGLQLRNYGQKSAHYTPLPDELITRLFSIPGLPEDIRNVWAVLAATGMRLDEAATLRAEQVKTVDGVLHFDLRTATVKNRQSQRRVPICDTLRPLVLSMTRERPAKQRLFSFPEKLDGKTRASEQCNYWMKKAKLAEHSPETKPRYTTHSLRGSFKDKMRDAGVPLDVHSAILGHDVSAVDASYGRGHSLQVMKEAVNRAKHPYLAWVQDS